MKVLKFSLIVLLAFFSSFSINAQETTEEKKEEEKKPVFKITGQVRPRAEMQNGYKKLPTEDTKPSYFVGQRTRIGLKYCAPKFKVGVSFQDVRVWGDDINVAGTGAFGNPLSTNFYEAWGQINFSESFAFKIGRQELVYDDARLLSNRNWNNYGLTYDAALLKYDTDALSFHLGGGINNMSENLFQTAYGSSNYKAFFLAYLKYNLSDDMSISAIDVTTGSEHNVDTIYFKNTMGANFVFDNKAIFARVSGYFQMGDIAEEYAASAYFVGAEAGYNVSGLYVGAGLDMLSGDDTKTTDTYEAFDQLYGARYKFHGQLNWFLLPKHTKSGGLMNPFFKVKYKLNKKNIISATFLNFNLVNDVAKLDGSGNYDSALGNELDLGYTYKITKGVACKLGYRIGMPSETLEQFKGLEPGDSTTPSWLSVMFVFKPKFLVNK